MTGYKTVYMRGGTSKGCIFLERDLPADKNLWDDIFLDVMGSPDPKQIDGMGGTVSSNNKIVVVWPSGDPKADVEYKVGQVIAGRRQIDWKSNCGNMTAAVGPFAIEAGLVPAIAPATTVRLLNRNTDSFIHVETPVSAGRFEPEGNCAIAGVDGTGSELKVNFLSPAGAKTGVLLPTGRAKDVLDIPGFGPLEATILDVSNPLVIVRAQDIGLRGDEMPDEINSNRQVSDLLEAIRGTACCRMGFAVDLESARLSSPAVPKVGFFAPPMDYTDLSDAAVPAYTMDICARVVSVFKLHKAVPLTSASAMAVAARVPGSLVWELLQGLEAESVRIGHPSGVMTVYPHVETHEGTLEVPGVAVARTARVIMEGTVYVRGRT